ncbi:alpha/beta fold hydrolase [Roseovarius sp. MMSF_3281]|uniref:alpha/beta fold hydrolase n=1 Tax=Roseovarius sp. MMSF_3281 TaxID=3046694 RepID=UPI00273E0AC1|nr:alpha/beta hydrolase [Roseovarius sp. MMSF_3281]
MPRGRRAGHDIHWTTFGQGPREALAIHCSLSHSGSWGGVARHVSGALTLTAFDMPGHGRSAPWQGSGEIQEETARIAASFCDGGPRDLIGHSFGATVALRLAVIRPDLVRSLTLIEPVFFAVAFADQPAAKGRFDEAMTGFDRAMRDGNDMEAAKAFTSVWGDGTPWASIPLAHRAAMADQMYLVAAAQPALYDDVGGLLGPGGIDAVTQPALLIEGNQSPAIIPAINEGLAKRLPRAERAVIAGAGHMAPITHAKQVGAEILRFLNWA